MSSTARKAPLQKIPAPGGWIVVQKRKDGTAIRAWARLPGMDHAEQASPADIPALREKAQASGAVERDIPSHWIALPTGLDLQVHLRFPGQPQKETLEGGLESALYGGYDSLVSMPNTDPFLDHPEALAEAIASSREAVAQYPVRVGFAASATVGMQGQKAANIRALAKAGAVAITDDGWGVKSPKAQEEVLKACAEAGLLFQQHAEMPGHGGVTPEGPFQKAEGLPAYPRAAESDMIRRDLEILRRHPKAHYHVLHVSTRESLEEIRRAKEDGLKVTAEATPHHLIYSNREIPGSEDSRSTYFKMNPPLFDPEDREALREALKDGTIDCVSTDHAPHEKELKAKGWKQAPFGTRGLETALPALMTLVHEGAISLHRALEVFSDSPRRVIQRPEFQLSTGLVFLDPGKEFVVGEDDLPGLSANSCFLGARLYGPLEIRAEASSLYVRNP